MNFEFPRLHTDQMCQADRFRASKQHPPGINQQSKMKEFLPKGESIESQTLNLTSLA
jgi:hypothetical protein